MTAADIHVERRAAPDPRAEAGSVATAAATHLVRLARPARGAARRMARVAGRAPATSAGLIGLVGLLVQTVGYAAGWSGDTGLAIVLFYLGLVVLLTPYAVLLLSPLPAPRSRVVAVVSFGLLMYASWLAASPVYAAAFDETLHVTTLGIMTDGGGWFAPNTMLPVSPHYPGLELATSAVHWATGLPLMACQVVVVALARTALVLGLYLLGSRLTGSARGGGIVVLLYAASPQFWFFNAQFSYQTVALALLVGAVVFLLRAFRSTPDTTFHDRSGAWWPMLGVQLCLGALAVTHHITSWLTVGALWLVALVLASFGEPRRARLAAVSAQLGLLVVVAWSALVAPLLARYLGPVAGEAGTEIVRLIRSDGGQRATLSENPANAAPLWETGVMGLSVLLWIVLLLPSLRAAVAGRSLGRSPARFVLATLAAAFPLLFAVRFSPSAGEIADRASTFVTLGVVLVVTAWLAASHFDVLRRIRLRVAVPAALVLLVGGLILGSGPDWQRTPGPFLAGAEQRSVDSETLAVADWTARYLPADSRIAADVTLDRVLPTVAPVVPVTGSAGSVNVTPLFINETLDLEARQLLIRGKVDFVFVDRRLEGETVHSGGFFEGTDWGPTARTLTAEQLGKFEDATGFRLVLDGPVQVYDVRSLRAEPQVFTDRESPGRPGDWQPAQAVGTGVVALLAILFLLTRRRRGRWRATHALPWLVSLPALVAIGALGVTVGMTTAAGVALGLLVAVGAAVGLVRVSEHRPGWWRRLPVAVAVAVLLGVIAWLSVSSAWDGLFDGTELPPPPTAQAVS